MQEFLAYLLVKPLRPLDALAEGLTFSPGPMMAIGAFKPSDLQSQRDRAIQDRQVAQTSVSALFDP